MNSCSADVEDVIDMAKRKLEKERELFMSKSLPGFADNQGSIDNDNENENENEEDSGEEDSDESEDKGELLYSKVATVKCRVLGTKISENTEKVKKRVFTNSNPFHSNSVPRRANRHQRGHRAEEQIDRTIGNDKKSYGKNASNLRRKIECVEFQNHQHAT